MTWTGIQLGYRSDMHIFRQGSVTAVRYRYEDLDPLGDYTL